MFFCHVHFNAFGKILHSQAAYQLVGHVSGHGVYAFHFCCRKSCNDRHYFVGNLNLTDGIFLINFMTGSLCLCCHNNTSCNPNLYFAAAPACHRLHL